MGGVNPSPLANRWFLAPKYRSIKGVVYISFTISESPVAEWIGRRCMNQQLSERISYRVFHFFDISVKGVFCHSSESFTITESPVA